ncbi:MAG: transposase [Oscillospiraceae bacterium]|nr:transposase [Oscillospiraceae bacterium]
MCNTTIKVRIHPTQEQARLLDKSFGCCRYLWNRMLADAQEFYAAAGEHFIPTPAKYKKEAPFLKEVDSLALSTVHQNLRRAFQKFFEKPEHYGYPTFKRKKDGKNSYTTYCQYSKYGAGANIFLTEDGIRLPKLEVVKATLHRKPLHWWKLKSATVSRTATGKYFCSLLYEYRERKPETVVPTVENTLGLNYSVSQLYIDSNGTAPGACQWLRQSQEKLAAIQRKLSRMERGSKNYERQLYKLRLLHEHIANQRKDFLHKESRRIANAYDAVCVANLNLREASQNKALGNVMDSGFGQFRLQLAYKLERQGKPLLTVEKYTPTARTCSVCGEEHAELPAHQRRWRCTSCGARLDRAENGAVNIKTAALKQFFAIRGENLFA